ncbi:MAG: Holliday junction DNA helicase RuvA [Candidatus Magasanikbacteria bacterium RIFCSPHIGHO2_02_FULL_47_14]|uniref:Holliday junction branch migration complex subunit RuvA n=1 Tax=Candidatus Magasanikbacteria bacterium RIFCSPHIGHO2_02_FULL_47_14 TaxID=1798680 RepID=A0A1F6M8G0_9BACT|nr:MAG: Holliday junction DNA helicase RuvA [Candidatus Magasanikbacteria bacterium RIFCSPHIGHO2_02_FULL_47_14]
MIFSLRGTVAYVNKQTVGVETAAGIGYEVTLARVSGIARGQEIYLYTYFKVSDSSQELFGFQTLEEKGFFEMLLTVQGVGPKTAMHILSLGALSDLQTAIVRGDVPYLTSIQGLGKKIAERVVVELKNKLSAAGSEAAVVDSGVLSEVVDALVGFGYSREEAKEMVSGVDTGGRNTESVLKAVLQRKK